MKTDELDFELPPELIAQEPPAIRSASRLLHYRRSDRQMTHLSFAQLPSLLRRGDLMIFNDAKVIPARFYLRKITGGRVEALFLSEPTPGQWLALLRNFGQGPMGTALHFETDPNLTATVAIARGDGEFLLHVASSHPATQILERLGRMPLPPYIKRDKESDPRDALDRQRYQTIYAQNSGAVAAPTAGLHFTPEILDELDSAGIERATITLHVGMGTFRPIAGDTLESHPMHAERYSIPSATTEALNRAKRDRHRIIAVGTTSARVLESQPEGTTFTQLSAETSIFIYPPYRWRHVDGLITNFHLPRSTLIALVAARVGLEEQRRIYAEAITQRYRFFSYGDAMLID